jgi:malonate transporter MadL subunit
MIYGTGLVAICLLIGRFLGYGIGEFLETRTDVGGVGIAMLTLMATTEALRRTASLSGAAADGIRFWSGIYIPIVVAMAATLDVRAALGGGLAAVVAGVAAVVTGLALVPVIAGTTPADDGWITKP